jgi:hypothetical protein
VLAFSYSNVPDINKWMNPHLHKLTDPAKAVTSYIKECIPHCPDLYEDATGTCFRVGATNSIFITKKQDLKQQFK